ASTVGAAPAGVDSTPGTPSQAFATATSVLEAWGASAESAAGALSPLALSFALKHASQSASASRDLDVVACQMAALLRIQRAMTAGFLSGDTGISTELSDALTEARAAVLQRAKSPDAVRSLEQMKAVMGCLLEIERYRQLLNQPVDSELIAAERQLLNRFLVALAQTQQIAAGVYQAPPGSLVADMNRFVATEYLRQIAEVVRLAQLVGLEIEPATPLNELKMQFALRGWAAVQTVLLSAEAAGDYAAFTTAVEDALEIAALNQTGFFPSVTETSQLPGANFLAGLPARLDAVFVGDMARPAGERSLDNQRRDLRRLTRILRQLPAGFSYNPAPVQRAFDRLETTLSQSMIVINTFAMSDLVALLDAGLVHAELRDRFSLPSPTSWETARLPQVLTRIATLGQQTNGWSEIHDAIIILLAEADRLATNNNQTRRQLYLSKAAELEAASRVVAVALWQNEKTRRNANPLLEVADMVLPGDIFIDRVAGAVRFDLQKRFIEGSFSGDLRLPKFGAALHVQNASINSGGAFALNLDGQTTLGTSGNSLGTVSIPARRPLAISFQPPADLKLSGGVKLALNNGMTFEAYGALTDPVYNFGFSAAGLRFDLATNLFGQIPEPVPGRLAQLGPNIRTALADYLGSLGATVEPLSGLTDPPVFADLGEPPDYSDSVFTISTDPLNAAASGIAIVVGAPFVLGYVAADATASQINTVVTPVVKRLVQDARREMDRARRELAKARSDLAASTGAAKEDARRALVKRLEATGEALRKVADAAQKIVQKQQAGEMGTGPDTNPAQTPESAAASDEQQASTEQAMDDIPATLAVDIELGLMASAIDYFETQDKLGGDPGDFTQAAQMYIDNAKQRVLPRFGMDLDGNITNQTKFNSLTEDELKEAGDVVAKIEQVSQLSGVQNPGPMFVNATREVLVRRRNLKAQEIQDAQVATYRIGGSDRSNVDALKQEKLMQLYQESAEIIQTMNAVGVTGVIFSNRFDGSPGSSDPAKDYNDALSAVGTAAGKLAGYLDSSSPTYDRDYAVLWGQQLVAQKLRQWKAKKQEEALKLAQANPAVSAPVKETMRSGLDALARRYFVSVQEWAASSPTLQFNLRSAEQLGRDLLGHAKLLERTGNQTPSPSGLPRQQSENLNLAEINSFKLDIFPKYTARITALAEAQKAWWILRRVNSVLLEGLETKATNDLSLVEDVAFSAAKDTVEAAGRVAGVLRQGLALQNRPVDLRLPGDVEVEKVFGDVFYNRQTGFIRATFGGRVEFPDLNNAFFEIVSATIDNNLHFTIDADTEGPLPFGGVTIGATINASGGPGLPFDFHGTGTMSITNGPNVMVDVNWAGATRTLSFDSQVGNLQSLRFTDNLVLFDAGFGLTIRPQTQSGELRANGSAGFFSKGALPASPTQSSFHLFADNIQAVLAYQPGQVGLMFSNGTLHLPTFFYPTNMAVLCPGGGPATGPSIALNPGNPIQATFFDGVTPSVSFSGELDFRQFGLAVPGIPGLAAAICNAQLKFSSTALPYLTNVTASLQVPLPRSTNFVDFENGVFTLTGYPSGRVELRNDLTMLDVNGFKFTLLGQGHPGCPGGSGLTVYPTSGFNQVPAFKLDGGIRVDAPLSMLTGENGDQVNGLACGSLSITNGLRPDLVVNTLAFGGTFHLGSGGPIIKNALISLQDLPNLFRLDDQHQFLVRLEGALQIPSGPEFTMQDAHFSFFDYQRLPRFSVASVGVNNENFTMLNYLPAKVKQATLAFKAPLAEVPYLLSPTNIDLSFSAEIRFPA
ncbi:MAG: hypothetical protein H7X97_07355, partial [Opitutaceae bacterium]|nr:hypothetical protein [Verrucomicrobiales bacterium]